MFIPAGAPPHKPDRPISPAEHRLAMVELAVADNASFGVSRVEIDRTGPSYAVDTLEALTDEARAQGEPADFTFILSAEAFRDLPTWREPRRLLELCRMAVVPRADQEPPSRDWMGEHFPGQEDRMVAPRRAPRSPVLVRDPGPGVPWPVDPVSRATAGRAVHRGASSVPERTLEEEPIVTEPPASPSPTPRSVDGLPTRENPAPAAERPPLEVARRIVEAAEDKKAADIVLLELGELTTLADYFVICSGGSERQLGAIADGVLETLRSDGVRPIGREGEPASHWVLLDFGSVVVHVFTPPERDFYGLEKHWSQARTILRVQ